MQQGDVKIENSAKKKKSIGKKIAIALLIVLLLPVVLAGLLLVYLNVAGFQYDDPAQVLAQNEPMSFAERNSFDAGQTTRTMKLDNADLYFLLGDILPSLHYNDSVYIDAYRMALEDEAIYLQGKVYGINVPIKVGIDAQWKDGDILLQVTDASLGKLGLPVPLDVKLEFTLSAEEFSILKGAESLALNDGYIHITYPVDKNFMKEGLSAWVYMKSALFYSGEKDELVMLVNDYQKNWDVDNYKSERFDEWMKRFEQNPDLYQELKVKILAAGPERVAKAFFSSEEYDAQSMARFFPGITPEAVEKVREQLNYEKNYYFLKNYALMMDEQYGKSIITVKNGRFVNKKSGKVLEWNSFFNDAPEAAEVFPEGTEFCAIFCQGADSKQKVGSGKYASATAVKFVSGNCAVICQLRENYYITAISTEEFEAFASGKDNDYIVAFTE